jgi:hypothetical protein
MLLNSIVATLDLLLIDLIERLRLPAPAFRDAEDIDAER